jgi:hypothetical protein
MYTYITTAVERLERAVSSETSQKTEAPRVFISYARTEDHFAQNLAEKLQSSGISVFYDHADLAVGEDFQEVLRSTIERCDFVVVLMSPQYFRSPWCQAELSWGLEANKRLLPVLIDGEPQGPLSYIQYLDASHDSDVRLSNEIAGLVKEEL